MRLLSSRVVVEAFIHDGNSLSRHNVVIKPKCLDIVVIVAVLLIAAMMFFGGGEHGPGRHTPSGDAGGQQVPPSSVMEDHAPPEGGRG